MSAFSKPSSSRAFPASTQQDLLYGATMVTDAMVTDAVITCAVHMVASVLVTGVIITGVTTEGGVTVCNCGSEDSISGSE